MSQYVTLPYNKKLNLLRAHCFGGAEWTDLDQVKWCLHCGQDFTGHAARVWQDGKGALWLECGTPDCSGSPIDWADYPWWDEKHPATKAQIKKRRGAKKIRPKKNSRRTGNLDDDIPF